MATRDVEKNEVVVSRVNGDLTVCRISKKGCLYPVMVCRWKNEVAVYGGNAYSILKKHQVCKSANQAKNKANELIGRFCEASKAMDQKYFNNETINHKTGLKWVTKTDPASINKVFKEYKSKCD